MSFSFCSRACLAQISPAGPARRVLDDHVTLLALINLKFAFRIDTIERRILLQPCPENTLKVVTDTCSAKNHVRIICFRLSLYLIIPHLAPGRERLFKSRPTPHQTSRPTHSHVKHDTEFRFDDEGADDDGSDTEGSLFGWEDEATLLSDLMEEESVTRIQISSPLI